jgi:hypothetical protein
MTTSILLSRCLRGGSLLAAVFGLMATSAFAQNPMEEAGRLHNEYLDCIRRAAPNGDRNAFELLINACGYQPEGDAEEFIRINNELVPKDLTQPVAVILEPHRRNLTEAQYAYALRMEEVLTSAGSIDEARKGLEALEAEAVANLGKEEGDNNALAMLSIARYSLEYWNANGEVGLMKAKWWHIVIGDAVGGLIGGVALGVGCSYYVAAYT